jgi:hypothetical protein
LGLLTTVKPPALRERHDSTHNEVTNKILKNILTKSTEKYTLTI